MDDLAATAYRCRMTQASCATGCGSEWDSQGFRALTWLSNVSTYYISRNDVPDSVDCNAVVVGLIPRVHRLVYSEPHLLTGRGRRTVAGLKSADDEFERRNVERRLFQRLSQYYPLEQKQTGWSRGALLKLGKHGYSRSTYNLPLT